MEQTVTEAPIQNVIPDQNVHATSGGGQQPLNQEAEQKEAQKTELKPQQTVKSEKMSVRQSIEAAAKSINDEDAAEKTKTTTEEQKSENQASSKDEKSAKPETANAGEQENNQDRQRKSEVRERPEAPARFLPRAKELWRNTPNEVQAEVSRMAQDHETEVSQYREAKQFRDDLKEFEDLAKSHNTTVKNAISNYVQIERQFSQNPSDGFRSLLANMNMQPQQAITHILNAFNVRPEQLAAHITENPNMYTALAQPQRPQQQQVQQSNTEMEDLRKQVEEMRLQQATQQHILPFAQSHPRYYELEGDIAFFLQSGKIPANLSPAEKLETAYDMAERLNPSSNVTTFQPKQEATVGRVDEDFNGSKSVKSSLGNVLENQEPAKKMSMREMLEDELKRSRRA